MDINDLEEKAAECTARLDLQGALGYLRAATSLAADMPRLAELLDRTADLLIGMGNDEEAWDTLHHALALRSRDDKTSDTALVGTLNRMIELAARRGDPRGLEPLSRLHAWHVADKGADHMLAVAAAYRRGMFLLEIGEFAEAEQVLRDVADLRERKLGARNPLTAETRISLARVAAALGRPDEARRLAEEAVSIQVERLGDGHPVTQATRGFISWLDEAGPSRAAPAPPEPAPPAPAPDLPTRVAAPAIAGSPVALNVRGIEHARAGRYDDALSDFRQAIALDAGYVPAHCNIAFLLTRQNRDDQARAALDQAIVLSPERVMLHVQSALQNYKHRHLTPAFLDIGKAVMADLRSTTPSSPLLDPLGKSMALLQEGNFNDGWWVLEEALRDTGGGHHMVLLHAVATHLMGNTKRAVVDLDEPDPRAGTLLPLIMFARVLLFEVSQWESDAAEELEAARGVAPHLFDPDFES